MSTEAEETSEAEVTRDIVSWLCDSINLSIPEDVCSDIVKSRGIDPSISVFEATDEQRDICKADLLMWVCTSPSRTGDSSDSDNSWSHKVGGYSISEYDKKLYISMANELYKAHNYPVYCKSRFKINSFGIRKNNLI